MVAVYIESLLIGRKEKMIATVRRLGGIGRLIPHTIEGHIAQKA